MRRVCVCIQDGLFAGAAELFILRTGAAPETSRGKGATLRYPEERRDGSLNGEERRFARCAPLGDALHKTECVWVQRF